MKTDKQCTESSICKCCSRRTVRKIESRLCEYCWKRLSLYCDNEEFEDRLGDIHFF